VSVDMIEQTSQGICTATDLNHTCMAVRNIEKTLALYRRIFGLGETEIEEVTDQGVRVAIVSVGGTQLEFIEPTDPGGAIARFIERRGEGLHHICFEVEDLQGTLDRLDSNDVDLIDKSPRKGLAGMVAFIHPRSTGGTLIELVDESSTGR